MKKVLLIVAAVATTIMFSACGGKTTTENNKEEKTDIEKVEKLLKDLSYEESQTEEAANMCLKEGFNIDAKFADWQPSFDINTEKAFFQGDATPVSYTAVAIYPKNGEGDAQKVTDEELHEVVRKIYAATAAVAEGGINIYGYEKYDNKEEAEKEYPLDELTAQTGIFADYAWRFIQDGKIRGVRIELRDVLGAKENALKIEIYTTALQKSFNSTMNDVEKALDDPDLQKEVKKALGE